MTGRPNSRVPAACLAGVAAIWIALAIAPRHRLDWLLENLLTLVLVPIAIATYGRFRFSDRAYVQCSVFVVLHTIGSHYTYSEVPFGEWLQVALGSSRNHYDRFVHFAFGALMLRPFVELVARTSSVRARSSDSLLAAACVGAWSAAYEILEWMTAVVVDPAAGAAFLGVQGDPWDAQKDMALALVGGATAAVVEALRSRQRRSRSSERNVPKLPATVG